jgi:hypothetical protein
MHRFVKRIDKTKVLRQIVAARHAEKIDRQRKHDRCGQQEYRNWK